MADSITKTATEKPILGHRQGNRPDEESSVQTTGDKSPAVPTGNMTTPGVTKDKEEKESLKIKVNLNLHAKVRLDLDAQLYGDIVIGLL